MECTVCRLNELGHYRYVVILSRCRGKWLFSRHKKRTTWETQGGHIEQGETPLDAARRELYEESGATDYSMVPLCDYWAADENTRSNGMVFYAEITALGRMPESEMETVGLFETLPDALTYPDITPKLIAYLESSGKRRG